METRTQLNSSDLFVVLEKAFRRRAPDCAGCTFTIPYAQANNGYAGDDWSVLLTESCSARCRAILEEIVARARSEYALAE
jgi:hypothetical protein